MKDLFLRLVISSVIAAGVHFNTASAGELRTLGWSKETSSSRCIGDPKTPECAVETQIACDIWGDKRLCDIVGYRDPMGRYTVSDYQKVGTTLYEFVGRKTISEGDAKLYVDSYGRRPWRAGDVAVRIFFWGCRPDESCLVESRDDPTREYGEGCPQADCERDKMPSTIVVRRSSAKWIHVGTPQGLDFPGEFWNRK